MCGFAGAVSGQACRREELEGVAGRMTAPIVHRGPDDSGVWADPAAGVVLGSRRLAILDLSPAGHMPMVSPGGRWVIAYNGEIYNHAEIAGRLAATGWAPRGRSDTEVLLAAIDAWGVETAVRAANGMFAFAVWDTQERRLFLARDRLGEKPLYYGWQGGTLLFGSELAALRAHPRFAARIDRAALASYFRHNCVPAPHSIYEGIHKLPPATIASIGASEMSVRAVRPVPYWSAREVAAAAAITIDGPTGADAVDELEGLLRDAVGLRMEADVPLGAFLSGGIDSSTVVALMQAQSSRPVRTFTIGFAESGYDESADAAAVARHLGTDHTSLRLSAADAIDVIPSLPSIYDEPFADASQIPTFLVSRLARSQVTVALSGDGGDEMWGGYNRHTWGPRVWSAIHVVPLPARRLAAAAMTALPPEGWDRAFERLGPLLPRRARLRNPGTKAQKLASVLPSSSPESLYRTLVSHWKDPSRLVLGAAEADTLITSGDRPILPSFSEQMMYLDMVTYLPDDILVKLDRAAMAVSLESRVPLLDHRVVEFAWRVPITSKIVAGTGKWALRELLHRYVPADLVERPKMGFGLPLGDWLRGRLRPWAEDLLAADAIWNDGYLDATLVRQAWDRHLSRQADLGYELWDVLMFQAWLRDTTGG